ncbi:MAG: hypothetical protein ABIH28_01560 [archaeon]
MLPNPNYRGVWQDRESWALFFIWLETADKGVCWENQMGDRLNKANINNFISGKDRLFFIKEYSLPQGHLLGGEIKYVATREKKGLMQGIWTGFDYGTEKKGSFYITKEKPDSREFEKMLTNMIVSGFNKKLERTLRTVAVEI